MLLARIVTDLGYAAHTYNRAAAAEVTEADVLLVDPYDRPSLTAAVELQTLVPGVRIVCVTDSVNLRTQAKALKPHAFVLKPFGLKELERALRKALWQ